MIKCYLSAANLQKKGIANLTIPFIYLAFSFKTPYLIIISAQRGT